MPLPVPLQPLSSQGTVDADEGGLAISSVRPARRVHRQRYRMGCPLPVALGIQEHFYDIIDKAVCFGCGIRWHLEATLTGWGQWRFVVRRKVWNTLSRARE